MDKFTSRAFEASEMFLIRRGYEIIERTWKANDGEGPVGSIAKEDNAIVFVTVKSRKAKDKGFPESTATREELEAFAIDWLSSNETECVDCPVRFDVIALILVSPDRAMIRHHINAISAGCDIDSEEE